jgi:predicted metal-binding membrane protein
MEYHEPGVRGAARTSFRFSVFCVGCCWALFAVMVVVGSMNLLWMAGLTVVLSLERVVSWGDRLARGIGVVAGVVGGAFVLLAVV